MPVVRRLLVGARLPAVYLVLLSLLSDPDLLLVVVSLGLAVLEMHLVRGPANQQASSVVLRALRSAATMPNVREQEARLSKHLPKRIPLAVLKQTIFRASASCNLIRNIHSKYVSYRSGFLTVTNGV